MNNDKINNLIDMEKDVLKHPNEDLNYLSEIFKIFSKEEIENLNSALNLILNDEKLSLSEKSNLLENSWKINRKFKVPTPEEFLTSKWIGPQAEDLYPHCKKAFIDFFDPKINKNKLITYCCTGWGKSTLLALIKYYRSLLTISLRNPTSYLHLAKSTRLTDVTVSFTKATAFDLVVKGLITILETSPMCERVHYERDMNNPEYTESGKILFCNTSKGNSMIRIGEVYYDVASEPMSLVGRNIISGSITETSFLSTVMPEKRVMKLLNELLTRIYNRFGYNNPNTTIVMDSSPNSLECKADQWVLQHKNDPDVLFINDKKWEVQPWVTPIWEQDHSKIFPMFKGTSTQPTKIITEEEREKYDTDLIMDMPIDLYELAKDDPSKILRDFGACPTASSDSKLISNHSIIEKCFVPNLPNIYGYRYASSLLAPEGLLWKEIKDLLFVYTGKKNLYKLKRYPNIERFIHIDLAEKKDMASISMCHMECDKFGQKLYIIDFILPILCKKEDKINIDSFKYLISDLHDLGQVNLKHVSYDRFQSSTSIQYLERKGFDAENLSLDNNVEYYLSFNGYMLQNRIKCGKNLVFKNNLKSLILTNNGHHGKGTSGKLTVDHTLGDFSDLENFDWENSNLGKNGKDASDSVCGAVTLCEKYGTLDSSAFYDYDEEIINFEEKEKKEQQKIEERLKNEYGLIFI